MFKRLSILFALAIMMLPAIPAQANAGCGIRPLRASGRFFRNVRQRRIEKVHSRINGRRARAAARSCG